MREVSMESNTSKHSWNELYDQCNDLRLPVSRSDSTEVLHSYIKAVYDETSSTGTVSYDDELEKDPIYIGKYSRLMVIINKILPF
jgi:hypothetical protein